MGKVQTNTSKRNYTINTTTVWDRIINLENGLGVVNGQNLSSQLLQSANVVSEFGADNTGIVDATSAWQSAINAISTTDYTDTIPATKVKRKLKIPAGTYKISSKLIIPSYIVIEGDGKHVTFIDSYINNGDPVFDVKNISGNQQFYVNIGRLTINGRSQNCQGIRLTKTSRWVLNDVNVYDTNREGLYLDQSWLGELYSPLIKSCGSVINSISYPAVKLIGQSSGFGSHAVSFIGGEIHGGETDGLYLTYGSSVSLYGTTIEGVINGRGIVNDQANSLLVDGCYFEGNKESIVEISETISSSYVNNYFGSLSAGGRGHIGITKGLATKISDNFFYGGTTTKIFDATSNSGGILQHSRVYNNHGVTYPLKIDQSLLDSAISNGSVIETYDANGYNLIRGKQRYANEVVFDGVLTPKGGIKNINNQLAIIEAGNGTPEGVVTTLKGVYLNMTGGEDTSLYFKKGPSNNNVSWLPAQPIRSSTAANRPTVTTTGYELFDTTLGKDIHWNGAVWVDSNSREVWTPNKAYALNTIVNTNLNQYKCIVAGTTGSTMPSHTTGVLIDGTVTWEFVKTIA